MSIDYTLEIDIDGYTVGIGGDGSVDLNVPDQRYGGIPDMEFSSLEYLYTIAKRHKTAYQCYTEAGYDDNTYTMVYESLTAMAPEALK